MKTQSIKNSNRIAIDPQIIKKALTALAAAAHNVSDPDVMKKDQAALDCIQNRDPEALYKTVHAKNISMCGVIPTTVMLIAANRLKASQATLVDHKTSGDVSGDFSSVVGYAGVIVN